MTSWVFEFFWRIALTNKHQLPLLVALCNACVCVVRGPDIPIAKMTKLEIFMTPERYQISYSMHQKKKKGNKNWMKKRIWNVVDKHIARRIATPIRLVSSTTLFLEFRDQKRNWNRVDWECHLI